MSKNKPLFFIAQQIKMVGREYVWKKINNIFLSKYQTLFTISE